MKNISRYHWVGVVLAFIAAFWTSDLIARPVVLFDGETFKGWEGPLESFRIEDGAIVGGTLNRRIPKNQFLSTRESFSDFELRLKFKIVGDDVNAGIQIRSQRIPDHHEMIGYQADIGQQYWGALYDESRRGIILAQGNLEATLRVVREKDWNEYRIRCEGKRVRLWINGYQTVDYTEKDLSVVQEGVIALQIHSGPPSEAWYRDITIEKLSTASPPMVAGEIVPSGAELEKIFDEGCVLTEGVASAPDGTIYFSDITLTSACKDESGASEAGHIWTFDPRRGKLRIFRSPSGMSNGIKFDASGNMIVAEGSDFGGRRVTRTHMKTGKSFIIAGLFEGRPFNAPNDITIDEEGRIYFTDPKYVGREPLEQPVMAVYRIDPDGGVHRIITDAGKPNGIAVSPDQKTLYLVSHENGIFDLGRLSEGGLRRPAVIFAYDLLSNGTVGSRRVLVDGYTHGPDGIVVDVEGNLYAAIRDVGRPGVYVYSPTGKEIAYIPTPLPTNVGFGRGVDSKMLYITATTGLYRIPVTIDGYHLPTKN